MQNFTAFSKNTADQSGNFFPLKLDSDYSGKKITCTGKNKKSAQDLDWVLKVEGKNSVFVFETDEDGEILRLSFKNAVFESELK